MIKGINKQMIVLKIEGNRLYESACFVIRDEINREKEAPRDMLAEANKILEGMNLTEPKKKKKHRLLKLLLLLTFALACAAAGFFCRVLI